MKELSCPQCKQTMVYLGKFVYQCQPCVQRYQAQVHCSTCGDRLSLLKACGAVNFFCNACNEMKSKSSEDYQLSAIT